MRNNLHAVIRCCRIIAAVAALAVLLSFEFTGLWQTVLKYAVFLLIVLLAGYSRGSEGQPLDKLYTALCVSLILGFTVLLSIIMPSSAASVPFGAVSIVSAVILAPIVEEMLFRGAMVSFSHPLATCILSSAVFGIFHGSEWLQAFLLGLLLSYFYISSRNIAVPIICHSANNLLAVICTLRDIRIPVLLISVAAVLLIYKTGVKNEEGTP